MKSWKPFSKLSSKPSSKLPTVLFLAIAFLPLSAGHAHAQRRMGGGVIVGHAVPRPAFGARRIGIGPRIVGIAPYRPYYYPYRRGITLGFYTGFGYPYAYPYYYYGAYGWPYSYGWPYAYSPYGYGYALPPASYVSMQPGVAYGGVRIQGAPRRAQVYADGYYVGIVDDFDGTFQHLNLPAGTHQIEIRLPGQPPITFDVNVQPGQTITYHAGLTQ